MNERIRSPKEFLSTLKIESRDLTDDDFQFMSNREKETYSKLYRIVSKHGEFVGRWVMATTQDVEEAKQKLEPKNIQTKREIVGMFGEVLLCRINDFFYEKTTM